MSHIPYVGNLYVNSEIVLVYSFVPRRDKSMPKYVEFNTVMLMKV